MELQTERLLLNYFNVADAELVARLAGDKRVVKMTTSIPYPYEPSMAVDWIESHKEQRLKDYNYIFAIRIITTGELAGCINIGLNTRHDRGYLGYWIGHDYWGNGYCTEALERIIRYGFEEHGVNKIWAEHKTFNSASGRVMEKAGMKHEGVLRNHYKQDKDTYLDMSVKSILKTEFVF